METVGVDLDLSFGGIPNPPEGFRSGFVGILGRPNVGKSTLMNALVGQKVAITSPIAQTTRNRLRGILTTPEAQIIFVDTPGIHKPHHELGKVLVKNARAAIDAVDLSLFVVDGSVAAGRGDEFVADLLAKSSVPVVLGLNKVDLQSDDAESVATIQASYQAMAAQQGWPVCEFSATETTGLEGLQQLLMERLEVGPYYYPPDLVTDQPERFIMGELLREQILLHTRDEIPHSTAIAIERVEETETITNILATVYIERPSQKGILIGKGGSMMKTINSAARQQMQKLIAGKVYLEVFVKVQPKWRQSRSQLAELGYRIET
jgi:GTPase